MYGFITFIKHSVAVDKYCVLAVNRYRIIHWGQMDVLGFWVFDVGGVGVVVLDCAVVDFSKSA